MGILRKLSLRTRTKALIGASRRIRRYEGAVKGSHAGAASNRKELARHLHTMRSMKGRKKTALMQIRMGRDASHEMGYNR